MDPKSLQKFLIPALAVAALIVVLALLSGKPAESSKSSRAPVPKSDIDTTDAGMTDSMPSNNALEWQPQANGMKFWDVKEGTGEPCPRDLKTVVLAHYTGWRATDGFSFDSSRKRGEPYETSLGRVVQGWQEGIPGMKAGGIRRIYIPSAMGYGPRGNGPDIPPNTDLIFEIKLCSFN